METTLMSALASIGKRWVRAFCEKCEEPTLFEVRPEWVLVCTSCGTHRKLERNGLLRSA